MNDDLIIRVLKETHTVALVGASDNPSRPACGVMAYLLSQGYQVFPVSHRLAGGQLLGQKVYVSLEEIPYSVDMVDVFRHADAVYGVAQEAITIGAKTLWLQAGALNEQAAVLAKESGLQVIVDRCPKIEIPRLGLEKGAE